MDQAEDPAARAAALQAVFEDTFRLRGWVEETLPAVYGFVFARCGADRAIAEDITQETMVELVRHRSGFDGRATPMTWACGIARHKIADHYRARSREERRRLRLLETLPDQQHRAIESRETREAVIDALQRLPEAQRAVLAFHYLDGMPVREIAGRIGRSESAVESLLARARDGFRRAWDTLQGEVT